MRRGLLPYALVAALVLVASSAALFAAVRPSADATVATPSGTSSPTASRAAPELSRTGRIAYWRDKRLWVSDIDGSLRYPIGAVDDVRRVSLTRWSIDGGSVAYVESGRRLFVTPVHGQGLVVPLPRQLLGEGYQIKDLRWSTDSRRIAATLLRPTDGDSDVFLVDLTASQPAWVRVTNMDDVFVGDWISPDEMLGYTAGGAIVVIDATANGSVRLLTGASGVSPIVAPDGRVDFLVGRVPFSHDPSFPFQTAMRASVWSVAADGSGARRETQGEMNDVRLEGRLPDGRYLVYRGVSDALATASDRVDLLPSSAGVVERVRVAPDGRTAYGFTTDKIVRMDLTKIANTADLGAMTVFLDTSGGADVWFPSHVQVVRGTSTPATAPTGRYAFELAGHVWEMRNGVSTLLVAGTPLGHILAPAPKWSPGGDRLLVLQPERDARAFTMEASVVDGSGTAARLAQTAGAGRSFAWSPSGSELAIAVDRQGRSGRSFFSSADLEIRFFDPSGRATRTAIPGTEVAWTTDGLFLIANGDGGQGQAIERVVGDAPPRTILTTEQLAAHVGPTSANASMSELAASADGSLLAVRLQLADPLPPRVYLAILRPDGVLLGLTPEDELGDVAWSPTSTTVGYSTGVRSGDERAHVMTADGTTVATQDGRFAGWSPDGAWYLVGRGGSLYAYPVSGGAAVRLGPGAAPVSAAPGP